MTETQPNFAEKQPHPFTFPNVEGERGEINRVAEHFGYDQERFAHEFLLRAKNTSLTSLTDEVWSRLDNTDSCSEINYGDWSAVERHAVGYGRKEWQELRDKMQNKTATDAPIIIKHNTVLHLVSGNTRLMVARAMGITPHVLVVDMTGFTD